MPRSDFPLLGSLRTRLGVALRTVVLAAVLLLPVAVMAGWLERVVGTATRAGQPMPPAFENAVRYVRRLPARSEVVVLAAQATPEGHWRFVNRSGEMLTAGTLDEMKRVVSGLQPEAKAGARLSLYMTPDSVPGDRAALKTLPAGVDLSVVVGEESYRLLRRSDAAGERLFAEVRANLVVEMGDRRVFEEAVWQLGRRLDKAHVRVLALEHGGPSRLPAAPRIDPATKRAQVDAIDPASLAAAMSGVAGQTLVMVGRVDRDVVYVKPSNGPEHVMAVKDLFKAAANADVNLVVLTAASTPRQPGGRNWLWQRVEVQGLEEALRNARMADFLNALGAPNRRFAVTALPFGKRAVIELTPAGDLAGPAPGRPVADFFSNVVAELTGRVAATSVQASLRSAELQQELDQRLLPGIPSEAQIAYGLLLVLGLLGVPVSSSWWQRLWPREDADDYAGHTGYWAACATRWLAFALVFLPLTAVVSAPYNLGQQVQEAATAPMRLWRWLRGTAAPRDTASAHDEPPVEPPVLGAAPKKVVMPEVAPADATLSDGSTDRPRFLRSR
jgi:hypothetical protein